MQKLEDKNREMEGVLLGDLGSKEKRVMVFPEPLRGKRRNLNGREMDSYLVVTKWWL